MLPEAIKNANDYAKSDENGDAYTLIVHTTDGHKTEICVSDDVAYLWHNGKTNEPVFFSSNTIRYVTIDW